MTGFFSGVKMRGVSRVAGICLAALAMGGLGGCVSKTGMISPVVSKHGYKEDEGKINNLKVGETTMAAAKGLLGSPSSMGTFNDRTWYYISETQESLAFFEKETTDRSILALEFDAAGKLASVDRYDVKDGRVVNFTSRETPTRGKELTFLEQMFGNVGRGLPTGAGGGNDGLNIPGGGGRQRQQR